MTEKQFSLFVDGESLVEYGGHLYECIGFQDGKYLLSDINDGYLIYVSEKALNNSSEFYYLVRKAVTRCASDL